MSKHLQRDFDHIHSELLSLFGYVEQMIDFAVQALCQRRSELVVKVLEMDEHVDLTEVFIEEEGLKILSLHHPVASDLRRISIVLKVNAELERIADLACNIAERAEELHQFFPNFPVPDVIPEMSKNAIEMVRSALDSFVNQDAELAKRVIEMDGEVDNQNREGIQTLMELMKESPSMVEPAIHCFSAVRHIERIGDHAENIAEDVIYLIEGEIIRHKHSDFISKNVSIK